MMRFPQRGRRTAATSHHLNTQQRPRTRESFACKTSNNETRPIRY
jgi:hypothetical protein